MFDGNSVKVLIVEDELIVALNLSKELESLGFQIVGLAASEDEAVSFAAEHRPDVILMDINLESGGSGLAAAKRISKQSVIPIIYVTAYSSDKIIQLAGNTNPYGYILKPYNVREIKAVINTALIRFEYENKIQASEQRLLVAMKAADLDVLEFDHRSQSVSVKPPSLKFADIGFQQFMVKEQFLKLFLEKDATILEELLTIGKPFSRRAKVLQEEHNKKQYVDVFLSNISYQNDAVQIGAIQDVSSHQEEVDRLQISDSVLNQMQESVIILDQHENICEVNPAFTQMLGYSKKDAIGQPFSCFLLTERKDDRSIVERTRTKSEGGQQAEVTLKCQNNTLIHAMMTVSDLETIDQQTRCVITLTDISRLVEAERRLNKIAFTDSLTGFGNRAYLNRLLKHLDTNADFDSVALFFIDLDEFKQINDTLGHEVGDKVLIEFSKRLLSVFRDDDHLVRIGGDEFVAIFTGTFDKQSLAQIGDKIIQLFSTDFVIDQRKVNVTCSLGIAYCSSTEFISSELLKQADSAMYHAKQKGKNDVCFYDKELANETRYRIFIEQGLKSAIKHQEISIFLQPIVNNKGKVTSVEALCRWYDKTIGFISPEVFIPVAEESQLIQALGFLVINESFLAKKQLIEAGYEDIVLNINFSERQLQNAHTYETVCDLLAQYELEASGFVIEITESILHSTTSERTIELLRKKGFRFAIDDFGTGYSSLSKLHDYSVSIVKIDKSFIDLLCTNTKQNIITQAIIELGKKLGYKVVAEGVEQKEQSDMLIEMGCDSIQGFYYAKPLPMHELLRYLQS